MLILALFTTLASPVSPGTVVSHFLTVCHAEPLDWGGQSTQKGAVVRHVSYFKSRLPEPQLQSALSQLSDIGWQPSPSDENPRAQTFNWRDFQIVVKTDPGNPATITTTKLPPQALQNLADSPFQMAMDTESVDESFSPLQGEGTANEIMFPAGRFDLMFYVYGQYLTSRVIEYRGDKKYEVHDPLYLVAYERSGNTVRQKWKVELVKGKQDSTGVLGRYLRSQNWTLKILDPTVQADLDSPIPLSYHSENSGDGGTDLGFIDDGGKKTIARFVHENTWQVTIPEEYWLNQRTHAAKSIQR